MRQTQGKQDVTTPGLVAGPRWPGPGRLQACHFHRPLGTLCAKTPGGQNCREKRGAKGDKVLAQEEFGTAPDGSPVMRVTLDRAGTTARLMSWGASLQELRIEGVAQSLVLGHPEFAPYPDHMRHFGGIAGPIANRIADGRAPLNGRVVELERNEKGITALHGGLGGTSLSNWTVDSADETSVTFLRSHPDGAGGLPGPVHLRATYSLDADGALRLEIEGTADQDSFCNPAHHSYWTLGPETVAEHGLQIEADTYLPVDDRLIPLGAPADVAGTRFDFRGTRKVVEQGDGLLDHNFCLRPADGLRRVCTLRGSLAELVIETDQPGLQVYDGSGLKPQSGHDARSYGPYAGIAIEPQHWPDAPNHADYPSIRLRPGETYQQVSRFHARKVQD